MLVLNGLTGETVTRHSSAIIPLLSPDDCNDDHVANVSEEALTTAEHLASVVSAETTSSAEVRSKRETAVESSRRTRKLLEEGSL